MSAADTNRLMQELLGAAADEGWLDFLRQRLLLQVGPVRVDSCGEAAVASGGRQLIVSQNVSAGTLLLAERPVASQLLSAADTDPIQVNQGLVQHLLSGPDAPRLAPAALQALIPRSADQLHALARESPEVAQWSTQMATELWSRVEDSGVGHAPSQEHGADRTAEIRQLLAAVMLNSIGPGHDRHPDVRLHGLFLLTAQVNHSCGPNAVYYLNPECDPEHDPVLLVRAVEDIAAGEAVTFSYIEAMQPWRARQQELRQAYLFTCKCSRCREQAHLDSESDETEMAAIANNRDVEGAAATVNRDVEDALLQAWSTWPQDAALEQLETFLARVEKRVPDRHPLLFHIRLALGDRLVRAAGNSGMDCQRMWRQAAQLYEQCLETAALVYPRHWPTLPTLHKRAYQCYVELKEAEAAQRHRAAFERIRAVCRGPQCSQCRRFLLKPLWCPCRAASYCNRTCQLQHWQSTHRLLCNKRATSS